MKHIINHEDRKNIKDAIRNKYAWPGGYPLFLITSDGAALCVECGRKEFRLIADAWARCDGNGWFVQAADVNWEDGDLYCDHCSKQIESAYGEDEDEFEDTKID